MTAAFVFLIGLMLSAFFSGSETGLYRVSRTRLILDALDGSHAAKGMVWLLNHPAIFVATTLVGNNVANYLTSFSIVIVCAMLFGAGSSAELIGPILMTPIVFVLGELLPKYLFYHAPYRLIRAIRPLLLLTTALFLPVSTVLGMLGSLLQKITGQTPFQLRLAMARGDLSRVLQDGHEAGLLADGQRAIADNLFDVGNRTAISFGVPIDRLAIVDEPVDAREARSQARRRNHPIVLVRREGKIVGFLLYAELCVREPNVESKPVIRGKTTDRHLDLLLRLYDGASDVAVLYDDREEMRCVVTRRQLVQTLIK